MYEEFRNIRKFCGILIRMVQKTLDNNEAIPCKLYDKHNKSGSYSQVATAFVVFCLSFPEI